MVLGSFPCPGVVAAAPDVAGMKSAQNARQQLEICYSKERHHHQGARIVLPGRVQVTMRQSDQCVCHSASPAVMPGDHGDQTGGRDPQHHFRC